VCTPGDPAGIGAEVACKALAEQPRDVVLCGDAVQIATWAARTGLSPRTLEPEPGPEPVEVRAIRTAVREIRAGRARGLVTGPIHKGRLAAAGVEWIGHTEFLGHLCHVPHPVMAFVGGKLRVALVTVHLPLRAVPDALTIDLVAHTVRTADRALRTDLGLAAPRLSVCGLNPHAGDGGVLGREELDVIAPAVALVRKEGVLADGPLSAETAFRRAGDGLVDLVVAMYHDQGLAPLKLVDFGRSVNWTLGLPFVRTSVDHGTADDIAGKGIADAASMQAALELADRLTG
jgi:4-hydroxythreonine-4-phosphate dehydrogenase